MKKFFTCFLLIVLVNVLFSQNNNADFINRANAKLERLSLARLNGNVGQKINSTFSSLPEQDCINSIPVCESNYTVANSYSGFGLLTDISNISASCLMAGEINSVWYSFTCTSVGRLKFMITPNDLLDDYDYALYDLTGRACTAILNDSILPIICNFSAANGKTGLDSSGTSYSESSTGSTFNPLKNLVVGHKYALHISNYTGSTFGYSLSFNGTTANIFGGVNSQIQNVVSSCGGDSLIVNLSSPVFNNSIASNGSDFTLSGTGGPYSIVSAYGVGSTTTSKIIIKLGTNISGSGPYSLSLHNGSDGNTMLNTCNSSPLSASTFSFTNVFVYAPAFVCQNQSFTMSATPATSYTWTGALVNPAEVNNQSLSIASATAGNFTFTLQTLDNCSSNTQTLSIEVNPVPNIIITHTTSPLCPGSAVNLIASGATSYSWSAVNPANDRPSFGQGYTSANFWAHPLSANDYKVEGLNIFGCSNMAIITVSALPAPIVTILGPDTVCYGSSAILTYSGTATSYTWNTGVINTSTIALTTNGVYTYSVTGTLASSGCNTNTGRRVYIKDKISLSSVPPSSDANDGYICFGDSAILTSSSMNTYTWSTGEHTQAIVVKPLTTTNYTISGTTASCGNQSFIYTVIVNPPPTVTISMSPTVCALSNSLYTINANSNGSTSFTTFTWSTGSHASNSYVPNVSYPYSGYANTISLVATDFYNCKASHTFTYMVQQIPSVDVAISNEICTSNTATLTGSGAATYTWNPGNLNGSNVAVSPAVTTNYNVRGSINGCTSAYKYFSVGISPSSSLTATANPSVICVGKTSTLTATGNGIFNWYASDTATVPLSSLASYVTPSSLTAGTYTYYVSSNCASPLREPVVVKILPLPTINISTTSTVVCYNTPFQLTGNGATTYTWSSPTYTVSNSTTVSQTNSSSTYYVSGTDVYGCISSATIAVSLYSVTPFVMPSTFSVCKGSSKTYSLMGTPTYTWSNGAVSTPITITPTVNTNYSVTTLDNFGCTRIIDIYITVLQTPTVNINSSAYLCVGNTNTLTAYGASTYTWNTGALTPTTVVTPTISQTYSVVATGTNGCIGVKTKSITPLPVLGFSPPLKDTVCYGTSASFTATGANNYSWAPTLSVSGVNNQMAYTSALNSPFTFTLTGLLYDNQGSSYSCQSKLIKTVQIWANPTITPVANPTFVCSGAPSLLSVTGASSYTWTGGIVSNTMSVVPSSSVTVYSVTGKDYRGCAATKTVAVNVKFMPVPYMVNTMSGFYHVCNGKSAYLNSTNSADSYTWQPGGMNTPSVIVTPTVTTTYTLSATSTVCAVTKTTAVTVFPAPTATIVSNGDLTCNNLTRKLIFQSNYSGNPYAWTGPGIVSPLNSSTISVNQPGVYNSTITAYTGAMAPCTNTASIVVVRDTVRPTVTVALIGNPICTGGGSASIVSYGAFSYTWSTGVTANVITVSPTVATTYSVVGANTNGCTNTQTAQITIDQGPTITFSGLGLICQGDQTSITANGADTYTWSTGSTDADITVAPASTTIYSVTGMGNYFCTNTATTQVVVNPSPTISLNSGSICEGQSFTISPAGANNYTYSSGTNIVNPVSTSDYTVTGANAYNCMGTAVTQIVVNSNPSVSVMGNSSVCEGSSTTITASGADSYVWSTGATSNVITETPALTSTYTVTGTDLNNCSTTETVSITVDITCHDVWPGDANSDGIANNLDVLELGLHYTQTGAPRATTDNSWQSFHANNWTGTITNGKNLNHSDCNGDGTINDNDTLAIFNNYGLTHAFKLNNQSVVDPQLSIVPDQAMVVKGTWGSSSIYLGDAATSINNINGVAFTVDFDNSLIESNSIYIEYENSFLDASNQNLDFRKLDFANGKIYTATTHTVNNNVSGYGKIATLHYQIRSNLTTDEVLNLGLTLANQSDASGFITPLTVGSNTLMALGASVGLAETLSNNFISVSPNPTNGNVTITSTIDLEKVEVMTLTGQMVVSETANSTTHHLNLENIANGVYFVKVYNSNKQVIVSKLVVQK